MTEGQNPRDMGRWGSCVKHKCRVELFVGLIERFTLIRSNSYITINT